MYFLDFMSFPWGFSFVNSDREKEIVSVLKAQTFETQDLSIKTFFFKTGNKVNRDEIWSERDP